MKKPILPKGTRDFNSSELYKRNYIIDVIKDTFSKFGFNPIETPSFERAETLLGKYGSEGERLIFKILKSGNFLKDADTTDFNNKNLTNFSRKIIDKALRYDLTVPFARYVVQNQNDISIPFKRYQIQNVWRADRPQKGRFREFLQCDADVIGSNSLMQEIDFICLFEKVFTDLNLSGCRIKINNRKLLVAICEIYNCQDKFLSLINQLDKMDKVDRIDIRKNLLSDNFETNVIDSVFNIIDLSVDFNKNKDALSEIFSSSKIGSEGLSEIEFIFSYFSENKLTNSKLDFDIGLARGIDYYTGVIFEVLPPENILIGSIAGGGRYDNLTEIFGLKNMSGIGISFGLDRIYLVLQEMNLLPNYLDNSTQAIFLNFSKDFSFDLINFSNLLRSNNINCEFFPDPISVKRQLNYANKNNIPYVIFYGDEEKESGSLKIKDMKTGIQQILTPEKLIKKLKNSSENEI